MSKFFCSNNVECIKKVLMHSKSYPVNGQLEMQGFNAVVFDKISRHHEDTYQAGGGGIYIVGTPLFRQGLENESIAKYVWEHFSEEKIGQIKKDVVGYWAALIVKNSEVYIINDYYGIFDVCYSQEGSTYAVGNQLADVVRCRNEREIDEYPFIMENLNGGAFEGFTSFKGVSKLRHDEYLKIKDECLTVNKYKFSSITYQYQNEDKAVEDIASLIKTYASLMSKRYGSIVIGMTGGLDSRLIFAAFNSVGADITFKHGISSGTMIEDKVIVEQLSREYGKPLKYLDWNQPREFCLSDQELVFEEVGFNNFLALGYIKHFQLFKEEAEKYDISQAGYFCEAIRLREWVENKGTTFSLYDFIDDYFIPQNLLGCYKNYDAYREYLRDQFVCQLSSIGINGDLSKIDVNCFEKFRWMMARFHDSRSTVNQNLYGFNFSLLSVPYIHEAILALPANVIRNGSFQIKVLERLDSKLLTFDVCSHRRAYRIKNYRKVEKLNKKNLVEMLLAQTPWLKKMVVKMYQNVKYNAANNHNRILDDIKSLNVSLPDYLSLDDYKGDLINLRAWMIGYHCLIKDKQ